VCDILLLLLLVYGAFYETLLHITYISTAFQG